MRRSTALRDDDEIPEQFITAWKKMSTKFLDKVSGKEIPAAKLEKLFEMWGGISEIMELSPVELAENWFEKYLGDRDKAQERLRNLASGMSESEFELLVG